MTWAVVIICVVVVLSVAGAVVLAKVGPQMEFLFRGFRVSALFASVAAYAVAAVALYYAWTYENPAILQSDELVAKMSYATTNNSNSSYAVNLAGIDPQLQRFIYGGRIVLFVVLSISFAFVAFSTLNWNACRLVRVIGLMPLMLFGLAGFCGFMMQSNWLSVVYMGALCVACLAQTCCTCNNGARLPDVRFDK